MSLLSLQLPQRAISQRQSGVSVHACASGPARVIRINSSRRTLISLLSTATLVAGAAANAADGFVPAKKPAQLAYTTLEESYKEKDETMAGDVGRFAAFLGAVALVTAYLANSPTEIARRIALQRKLDEEALMSNPLFIQYKAEWAVAIKRAADKNV